MGVDPGPDIFQRPEPNPIVKQVGPNPGIRALLRFSYAFPLISIYYGKVNRSRTSLFQWSVDPIIMHESDF